ncbi:hypothetical protein ACJJTC_014818 [Scirpophaga incertulas]
MNKDIKLWTKCCIQCQKSKINRHTVSEFTKFAESNGMVERWHRSLKAALTARLNNTSWVDELPTVMLGLRTTLRSDNSISAAEMTFGRTLRLPFTRTESKHINRSLKAAYILNDSDDITPSMITRDTIVDSNTKEKSSVVFRTRSGREVRPPTRFLR